MIKKTSVLLFFMTLFTAVAIPAIANESRSDNNGIDLLHALRAGLLAHDVDNLWSGTRKEGGVDLNTEMIFSRPSFSFL